MITIENKIIGLENINWRDCEWIQDSSLKNDDPKSFEKLKNSLVRHHFVDSFKVWKTNTGKALILDGRTRKLGMMQLEKIGYVIPDELPAQIINCNNQKEAAELVLVFNSIYNKITEEGLTAHLNLNDIILSEIKDSISLDGIDLNKIFLGDRKSSEELNKIPKLQEIALTQRGDIFELDEKHRIMIGDSTSESDVKELLQNRKADFTFTDPPYNLNYKSNNKKLNKKFIEGDSISNDDFYKFLNLVCANIKNFNKEGAAVYVWMDWRQYPLLSFVMRKYFHIEQCIVWDKTYCRFGGSYRNQHEFLVAGFNEELIDDDSLYADIHEFCAYSRSGKKITKWFGSKSESNIWYLNTIPPQNYIHPTEKPVELSMRAIENSSFEGDIVLDLFLGSGSTLIGAAEMNRKCFGMELDPLYMDRILKRFIELYPEKEVKCMNREFDFNKLK